jgi:hypothetical protein
MKQARLASVPFTVAAIQYGAQDTLTPQQECT